MSDDELISLFPEPTPRPSPYTEHLLTVIAVETEDGSGTDEYMLQHGTCEFRDDDCLVESTVRDLGLRGALNGVWSKDPVALGSYRVRGWVQKYDVPGAPIEYDAGIEIVDPDE
jgi:hypothetical protein